MVFLYHLCLLEDCLVHCPAENTICAFMDERLATHYERKHMSGTSPDTSVTTSVTSVTAPDTSVTAPNTNVTAVMSDCAQPKLVSPQIHVCHPYISLYKFWIKCIAMYW